MDPVFVYSYDPLHGGGVGEGKEEGLAEARSAKELEAQLLLRIDVLFDEGRAAQVAELANAAAKAAAAAGSRSTVPNVRQHVSSCDRMRYICLVRI